MKWHVVAISLTVFSATVAGKGHFFKEYWAEFNENISNHGGGRWRVNDPELSLHPTFGRRAEARANGLMLIDVDEDLFSVTEACLYMELWGGHPRTAEKRFFVNGRGPYPIESFGTEENNCTYTYPAVDLKVSHLVRGVNAFQFACERGEGFWGHFIIDNAAVRCRLAPDHPDIATRGLDAFSPAVRLSSAPSAIPDSVELSLEELPEPAAGIVRVDYFARYEGFDDDGDLLENDWHGFTLDRKPLNHVAAAAAAPYRVTWDTRMIPTQTTPMALKAVVTLRDGLFYETEIDGLTFAPNRPAVKMFRCGRLPAPFWSRASQQKSAVITLPADLSQVVEARLQVKVWDGGAGGISQPFKINDHAFSISGRGRHDVVYTDLTIAPASLRGGDNVLTLLSDTDHHGIEILLPGPCLTLRFK